MRERIQGPADRRRIVDALSLAAIVWLSALPYLGRLDFYSDDWGIISHFEAAARSGGSVIAATLPNFALRPVQGVYLALLYDAFGLRPLGYHLVNTGVIALAVALFYLLLLRLRLSRGEAFAAALIFALLPQLSTVRVWFAAFQIPLSMLFMLVAMHAQLSARRSAPVQWSIVAVIATALSIAAYEIFILIIAGFAAVLLLGDLRARRIRGSADWRRGIAPAAVLATTLSGGMLKLLSARAAESKDIHHYIGLAYGLFWPGYDWRINSGLNLFAGTSFYSWVLLRDWASSLAALFTGRAGAAITVVALLIASLAWWRLRVPDEGEWKPKRVLVMGVAAFLLAHAIFVFTGAIVFAPSGIGNRTLVAAAVGFAITLVALFELVSLSASPRHARTLFTGLVVLTSVAGTARVELIDRYWAEAPEYTREILRAASVDLRNLPEGSTVILDGVCPYHGPAIVFETYWDVSGALSIVTGRNLRGDAVSPRMWIVANGIKTSVYDEPQFFPFGATLFVYNPRLRVLAPLPDQASARRYFGRPGRWTKCPVGYPGQGVVI